MDSAPTSSLRFRNRDGTPQEAPEEWTTGYVEVCIAAESWQEASLYRQDAPLPLSLRKLAGETVVVAEWPLSGAGHYRLVLDTAEGRENTTWTVPPRKLSEEAYQQLFADLEQLPVSIAIALQKLGALAGLKLLPPSDTTIPQELLRLQRAVRGTDNRPGLAQILTALSSDPYAILRSHAPWVALEQARRVHPTELIRAYVRGHNLDAAGRPLQVADSRVEHTVDVYENRLLRSFHDEVSRRLRRLQRRLETTMAASVATAETHRLQTDLRRGRLQASFLDEVGLPRELPTHLTMVLLRRPEYRAALEGFLEFRRATTVQLKEPALDAPLTDLPRLYETWGTMQIIHALLETGRECGYRLELERLIHRDPSGAFVQLLRDGRPAVVLHHDTLQRTVRLLPQRTYSRGHGRLHSASYEQRPDVSIEIEDGDGTVRILIFDPKYKLDSEQSDGAITDARPKKTDIDKMHAYRDAIRNQDDQPVVSYAAILYPGPTTPQFGSGVAALPAIPDTANSLRGSLIEILSRELRTAERTQETAA
jgi:predicted component of viral defense system (DUF524 family)